MTAPENKEIDKAFLIILNEMNKKDERIRELEEEVYKLNLQLIQKQAQLTTTNAPTIDNLIITNQSKYIVPKIQNESQRKIYESDTEKKIKPQGIHPMSQTPSNSFLGGIERGQSRNDVKNYLAVVKEQIDSKTFKDFIKCIKMLTNKQLVSNKKEIFENVEFLLGEEHKDLYVKFEEILGYKK